MRLSRTYEILKLQIPKLNLKEQVHGGNFRLLNINEVRVAINKLSEIKSFRKSANSLLANLPLNSDTPATVTPQIKNEIFTTLGHLRSQAVLLLEALEEVLPTPSSDTIYLRLPHETNLQDLHKNIETIQVSFDQIFSGKEEAIQIKLDGFDVGSEWLILKVLPASHVGTVILVLIGAATLARKLVSFDKEVIELDEKNRMLKQEINFARLRT